MIFKCLERIKHARHVCRTQVAGHGVKHVIYILHNYYWPTTCMRDALTVQLFAVLKPLDLSFWLSVGRTVDCHRVAVSDVHVVWSVGDLPKHRSRCQHPRTHARTHAQSTTTPACILCLAMTAFLAFLATVVVGLTAIRRLLFIHSFINTHKAAEKYKTQYTHNKKEKVHKNTTQKHKT